MARWSTKDIPDLSGRTAIVTGANSGIGFHTAAELVRHGAGVVVATRDRTRGEEAVARLRELATSGRAETSGGPERVRWAALNLTDLASIRRFADEFLAARTGLHLLVNNAGVMMIPRQTTVDGFETQFGTNHLGHFALTGLLLPALLAVPGARVVTVSSGEHTKGRIDFDDLMGERRYGRASAYSQSKLANLLFTFELARRAEAAGVDLRGVAAHPGLAATNLGHSGQWWVALAFRVVQLTAAQSAADGALPSLRAATAPDVVGGQYYGPDGRGEQRGAPTLVRASDAAYDTAVARRLWTVSEELTGVRFDALGRHDAMR
jgi:NAD(P)-dependent dehydrogenase (short-subunit alcohol dehydrogenase family)